MKYNYVEKAIQVTRREFVALIGIAAAILWSGAYAVTDVVQDRNKYIKMRTMGLYKDDEKSTIRQSHHNKSLMDMYAKLAGKPLSPMAEELFHTTYIDRTKLA
jgi:ferredoxin hydrogenase small subunit